jgi:hypothetical protein
MIPLYEVWIGHGEPTTSQGFNGWSFWNSLSWDNLGFERLQLPLPWAKAYAAEVTKLHGVTSEVRGIGKNYRKVHATFA